MRTGYVNLTDKETPPVAYTYEEGGSGLRSGMQLVQCAARILVV